LLKNIKKSDKSPIWISPELKEDPYWKQKIDCKNRLNAYNCSVQDPKRIGYFTGLQPSGKWIITLDFDIYNAENIQNEFVYDEYNKVIELFNNSFQSSTCGNYGMIVDITNSKKIQELIINDGRQKIDVKGLEILFNGTNSILPPTITTCKRHNKECQNREFKQELESVRILEICDEFKEEDNNYKFHQWFNNIINLSKQKKTKEIITKEIITKEIKPKPTKPIKDININIEKKNNDDINDKMLRRLLDCLDDDHFIQFQKWFKLTTIIKNAFGEDYYDTLDEYNQKYEGKYNKEENKKVWDSIKLEKYNIGYLIYIAKEDDPVKYKEYQKLFNTDLIINEKTMADYIHMYNNNFIIQDNTLYYFNNRIWVYGKTAENYMKGYISNELYMFILSDILINYASTKEYLELVKNLQKYCMTMKHKEQVIKTLFESKPVYENNSKRIFDSQEEIFMFTNGCFDLTQDKFIYCNKDNTDYFRSLYITLDCGYSYEKAKDNDIKFINSLLDKIFLYKEEHKNKFLEIVSTGLIAKLIPKMHIFVGGGGNGKSLIMEYVKASLGSYYVNGEVEMILTNSKKTSTAEGSLHNKRLCLFSEPDSDKKINNAYFKALTGENKIVGKLLYENTGEKNNNNTFIILTNDMPEFKTSVSNGEIRRLDVIKFDATFTDDIKIVDNKTVFKADMTLSNIDKQQQYKYALFHLLTISYKNYKQRNYVYNVVNEFEIEKAKYISKSEITLTNIFNLIEEDSTKYIKIKELYLMIKDTETYNLMTAREKKKFTKENLQEYIEKNILFKNKYVQKRDCKVLLGYKYKLPDRDNFDDDDNYDFQVNRINELSYNN